jgi:hypothetical protein
VRARANSLATAAHGVTLRGRQRAQEAVRNFGTADRSLLNAVPASAAASWRAHHAAACHYNALLLTWARYSYGALAWLAECALLALRWTVHSPARLVTAVATIATVWFWI